MKVLIIGGGAAGYFTAINIAEKHPDYSITIIEKSSKVLQKVKVSGGGRCNVTNARKLPNELVDFYPRGNKKLYQVFKLFSTNDMVDWLKQKGIMTKSEEDLRVFPVTDSSETIIGCFQQSIEQLGIKVMLNTGLKSLELTGNVWKINETIEADKVVIATGSSPATWKILSQLGLEITEIVPSLFTFNIKDKRIHHLQGLSFPEVGVKIEGTKLSDTGPLLITHWGMSGPAILKLSSWGAYELNKKNYQFRIHVNFLGWLKAEEAKNQITNYKSKHPGRKVCKYPLFDLPRRFWERMIHYCGIDVELTFNGLSKKQTNKLIEELCQGVYDVSGKSTFKEEFVTAGGVKLSEIDLSTFESKRFAGLYLAGEVLDVDALTGGFNFQACWSAGWVISENI